MKKDFWTKWDPGLPGQMLIFAGSVVLVSTLGILDVLTGYEIDFSIFYFIPVAGVSWLVKGRIAYFLCFLSAVVWWYADISSGHVYASRLIPFWNMVMRLLIFLIISYLIRAIRHSLETEMVLSRSDSLTGLANSRYFYDVSEHELNNAKRYGRPFSLMYMDLDNFKYLNDLFSHETGNEALKAVADSFRMSIRKADCAARIGGDEFVVLLPNTGEDQAKFVTEKIMAAIRAMTTQKQWPISLSIGVVSVAEGVDISLKDLIRRADILMYRAKDRGKNGILYETVRKEDS